MSRTPISKGLCCFCGQEFAKSAAKRHLAVCVKRQEAIVKADAAAGKHETLYHLRAQAAYLPSYWLDLEVRGSAKLKDVDYYLREIWLECCGHMSQFSYGGWSGSELAMSSAIGKIFGNGADVTHIYDFGSESVTLLKTIADREGKALGKHPVTLLMRNQPPAFLCQECQQPATWLCLECIYEEEKEGTLCDKHAEQHPHGNYGEPLPLVNSPRVGVCGYEGPAEPPY